MLTYEAMVGPWSPQWRHGGGLPIKPEYLKGRTPVELTGLVVFQKMQCRNCHAIAGEGGHRGPDLTRVATRMTNPQLVRQVIQGGGNMPAYGKEFVSGGNPAQLVAYLSSLHPPNVPPAREAVGPLKPIGDGEQSESNAGESDQQSVVRSTRSTRSIRLETEIGLASKYPRSSSFSGLSVSALRELLVLRELLELLS